MIKVVTVCGAGVGSSMMLKVFTQQILEGLDVEAIVDASDISSVYPNDYDVLITTTDFAQQLRSSSAHIIRIDNMMDKAYLKSQLVEFLKK